MNADEVRAWLAAQIDDDERVAKAAAMRDPDEPPGDSWTYDGNVTQIIDEQGRIVLASGSAGGTWLGRERGTHIARFDPARALREVEAKRRRLERHAPEPWKPGWPGHVCHDFELINVPDGWTGPLTHWCDWCSETQSREEWFYAPWPCPDVIDDAQAYADRPGFPAELRLP